MTSKKIILSTALSFFCFQYICSQNNNIVANPMDLNYRFQFEEPNRREAADPVCEYFNGKYYLFASKSGGYWSSPDLANWTYIPSKTIGTIEYYAPTILVMDNAIQVNFADHDFTIRAPHDPFAYQYIIEASEDGEKWKKIVDKKIADGYIVNVFLENGTYVTSFMVHDNEYEGGFFNRDSNYLFTVDAFNSNGVTKGTEKVPGTEINF